MARLEKLEQNSQETTETEAALAKVRRMISRAHLVEPFIIMEALELLAESVANEKHKEAQFYRKAYITCRKYEESKFWFVGN